MATIQRLFGIKDDPEAGGSSYDKLTKGEIPDATLFWPVTGGTLDKGLERIDRNDEVRGRRAATPSLPFRARPVMTVPIPAYRSVLEKQAKKTLGSTDTVTGGASEAQTHSIASLEYPVSTGLPPVYAQLVRDDLNHKVSGAVFNRFSWTFPLDGEGTTEVELLGLYHANFATAAPTASFSGLGEDVLMLRDAQVFTITGTVNEIQKIKISGTPTGGTFKLAFDGQTTEPIKYNATSGEVQTALLQLSNLDSGDVVASGGALPGAEVTLTFGGHYAGRNVPAVTIDFTLLTGGTETKGEITTSTPGTSEAIPDLQGFELTYNNNAAAKFYARRNIVTQTIGTPAATKKLWFPNENKISAAQDVTYAINMGNVNATEELAMDFSRITKFVFECYGGVLATTPAATELLRVTIYAGVTTGGGADALSARDDITSRFEGSAFYSSTDSDDIKVEIVNASSAAIT